MVEHPAVNRRVAGSSPARGAKLNLPTIWVFVIKRAQMFFTYVLYSQQYNKIYIGQTCDLEKRLSEHNLGLSSYTRKFIPWNIIYTEQFESRQEALIREKQLKSQKGREFIWNLIKEKTF